MPPRMTATSVSRAVPAVCSHWWSDIGTYCLRLMRATTIAMGEICEREQCPRLASAGRCKDCDHLSTFTHNKPRDAADGGMRNHDLVKLGPRLYFMHSVRLAPV